MATRNTTPTLTRRTGSTAARPAIPAHNPVPPCPECGCTDRFVYEGDTICPDCPAPIVLALRPADPEPEADQW
jgi:hypothetical protein